MFLLDFLTTVWLLETILIKANRSYSWKNPSIFLMIFVLVSDTNLLSNVTCFRDRVWYDNDNNSGGISLSLQVGQIPWMLS